MDFGLSKEHLLTQKAVREFCKKEMAPLVEQEEEDGKFPLDLFPKMGDLGYLGASFPEEYGGKGKLKTYHTEALAKNGARIPISLRASIILQARQPL